MFLLNLINELISFFDINKKNKYNKKYLEIAKNISELNDNKGFAIWIDKSILNDINREIYEFTFFTRKDVKLAETEDGKISITNCRYKGSEKWNINKEFYL